MKKMKRLLALMLAFCLTFSLAATAAAAAEGDAGEPIELTLNWNEEYTAATADVTVPAGGLKYYSSYRLGGMVITIPHEQAYVVYNGETYYPVNGVVAVTIPSAIGMVYTELAIGNTGGSDNTYTLNIAPPLGTSGNPQILTDSELGYFTAELEENDDNGYEFQWTATSSGYLYVGATSSNGDCNVSLYNKNTYSMRQMWTTDSNDESICSNPAVLWVNEGDVIGINLAAMGDSSFHYAAMTVEAVAGVAAGTSADPIPVNSSSFVAEVGAGNTVYYSGYSVGMTLSITGADLTNVSVTCGRSTYTDDDGDGVILAQVTRSLGSFGGGGTTVSITNSGESNGYYTVAIPVGAESNPDELELGENKAELDESESYFYTWTAKEDGELTLAIDTEQSASWYFTYNIECASGEYTYGDYAFSDVEGNPSSMSFAVTKGDRVVVEVTSNGTPGAVVLNASFKTSVEDLCAGEHSYEMTEYVNSNCTTAGHITYTCTVCGHSYTNEFEIAPYAHAYETSFTEPTCTEDGYMTHTCSRCGKSYTSEYIDPTAYLFQSKLYLLGCWPGFDLDPEYMTLIVDRVFEPVDWRDPVVVPAAEYEATLRHLFWVDDAMVQQIRDYHYYYNADDQTYTIYGGGFGGVMDEREYLGFVNNDGTYEVYFCHITYDFLGEHLPDDVNEWTYAEELGNPDTIEYDGIVFHSGPEGYYTIVSYDNYGRKITVEINDDNTVRILSCEDYTEEDLPEAFDDKSGEAAHEFESVVKEPTCTEHGQESWTCKYCGINEMVETTAPPTGHSWDEGVVTVEPTEESEGERTFTCSVCGETKTESIPKVEHVHNYIAVVTDPTCLNKGYTTYTCACGDSYMTDYTEPTGQHSYDDEGVCSSCGKLSLDHRFVDVPANAWYYSYVDFVVERGLMNGTGTDTFAPTTVINRASVAVLLWNMAGQPENNVTENPFNDVKENFWYTDAIFWAYENGVVSGNGAGGFNPNNDVTREQLAVMLFNFAKFMGYDLPATRDVDLNSFPDGDKVSGWASSYLKWACDLGLINGKAVGGQTLLAPKDTATRAEIAVIFTNFTKLMEND